MYARNSAGAVAVDWVPGVRALLGGSIAAAPTVSVLIERMFPGDRYPGREVGRGVHGLVFVGNTPLGSLAVKVVRRAGPFRRTDGPAGSDPRVEPDWRSAVTCHTDPTELVAMRTAMRELVATGRCHNVVQFVAAIDLDGDDGRPCRAYVLSAADGDLEAWLCAAARSLREVRACIRQVLYAVCQMSKSGLLHNDLYGKNILFEQTEAAFVSYEGMIGDRKLTLRTEGFFFSVCDYGLATTTDEEHARLSAECFPENRFHAQSLAAMPTARHVLDVDGLSPWARDTLAFLVSLRRALPRCALVRALLAGLDRRNATGTMDLAGLESYVLWAMETVDAEADDADL